MQYPKVVLTKEEKDPNVLKVRESDIIPTTFITTSRRVSGNLKNQAVFVSWIRDLEKDKVKVVLVEDDSEALCIMKIKE
jgi:hypothetical protein